MNKYFHLTGDNMKLFELFNEEDQLNELNWKKGLATGAMALSTLGAMSSASAQNTNSNQPIQSIRQQAEIDYTKDGPITRDSKGQKLEYGIPVDVKGNFIQPNRDLPDNEYMIQLKAYKTWKADFLKRWPHATQLPDGSISGVKPGLASPNWKDY